MKTRTRKRTTLILLVGTLHQGHLEDAIRRIFHGERMYTSVSYPSSLLHSCFIMLVMFDFVCIDFLNYFALYIIQINSLFFRDLQ